MSNPDPSKDLNSVEAVPPVQIEEAPAKPQRKWIRYAIIGGVLVAAAVIAVIVVFTTTPQAAEPKAALSLDDVLGSRLRPRQLNGTFHRDGRLLQFNTAGDLVLYHLATGLERTLLPANRTTGLATSYTQKLSADARFVLLEHHAVKLNRHSRLSSYEVLEVATATSFIIPSPGGVDTAHQLQFAAFGPVGNQLVFVYNNDIYYMADCGYPDVVYRLTSSGNAETRSNGIADWVYEEEIFGRTDALWFSSNGQRLAFAEFDDSAVGAVTVWHWGQSGTFESQYPGARHIRYPKVGTPNPSVRLLTLELPGIGGPARNVSAEELIEMPVPALLKSLGAQNEPVLAAVDWVSDTSLVAVWQNRQQNRAWVEQCGSNGQCSTIVELSSTTGWVDISEPLFINTKSQQIALVQPHNGHKSVIIYPMQSGAAPYSFDFGAFHVERIVHWDTTADVLFFVGNSAAVPQERHLYAALTATPQSGTVSKQCLSCGHIQSGLYSHFDAAFSSASQHLVLSSQGPAVPRFDVFEWSKRSNQTSFTVEIASVRPLQTNEELQQRLAAVAEPQVRYMDVRLEDSAAPYTARVRLLLPPDFDERTVYPMVVFVYAGPSTYAGSTAWSLGWSAYMASNRSVVMAQIDGRGSARRDVAHLHSVYGELGRLEVADQIYVAGYLASNLRYIDGKRIGIWGRSYGGYATAMALATDTANVFRCGASVAPVTDWKLYDTLYTERYMGLAADNVPGYRNGSVLELTEQLRDKRLYLVHGTADDNVHFQQSMELARRLELADIAFEQMSYPNEDHSLSGVQPYFYKHLTEFFDRCFE